MTKNTRTSDSPEYEQGCGAAGVFTLNPRTLSITRAAGDLISMLGYPSKGLSPLTLPDIWPDDADREHFVRLLARQQAVADYYTNFASLDGTLLPVTVAASSFPGEEITCIVSSRSPGMQGEILRIFDSLPDAVLILDRDGTILFANAAAATLAGASSPAELIGRDPLQFARPEYAGAVTHDLTNVRCGREGYLAHYQMRDLHGNDKWVEALGTRFLFNGREAILATLRDITERESTESELALTNQHFRDLYRLVRMMCDNVPDLIWAKNTEKQYLFANKAVCEKLLNAVDTSEPLGKTDMFFVGRERRAHPDNPAWHTFCEICSDSDEIVMESGKAARFDECGNIRGELLFFDVVKAPFRDEDGRIIGTVGCGRDVTAERLVEEKLRWNEALLTRMAQASPLARLVIDDRTDEILYLNSRFSRMWGLSHLEDDMRAGKIRGSDVISLSTPLFKDPEAFAASWISLHDEANRSVIEDEIELTDGRYIKRFSAQIRDADDRYFGRLHLLEDITEQKSASEALRRHDAIMHAVSVAADRFLKEPDWKAQMDEVLGRFGRATDVSGVYVFENVTDPATGNLTYSRRWGWHVEGIDDLKDWNIPYGMVLRWHEELAAGRPIVGLVRDLPDAERDYLEPLQIQSIAIVPIFVHQQRWGFIGFDERRRERVWSPAEVEALQAAASIIGSAILRTMNEEIYRNPVEHSPVGVYLMQDGYMRYFNTRLAEIFGYSRDELREYAAQYPLIAPGHREDLQRRYQALLSGETASEHHEFCGVHKDGRIIYLENFATRLQFEGRPAVIGSLMDVTGRKEADEALGSSEERLKIIFDYAPDAFFLVDMDGFIVDGNRTAERLLGCTKDEFIGRSIVEAARLLPEDLPKVATILDQLAVGAAAGPIGLILTRSDGTRTPIEAKAFQVTIDGRQLALAIGRDTSERHQLEDLKKKVLIQIEENIEQLSILNDSIRNPLTVIIALAEMGDTEIDRKIIRVAWEIDAIINRLDQGWLVSRKVKEFLKKHYA